MPHPRFSGDEIVRLGEELYEATVRALVETDENIGKIVSIDVETGDFAVDADPVRTGLQVQAKHPGAAIYGKRIGYNAAFALGGTLTKSAS
ncbi:hypothetical protein [Armatimonas rosea]|uniref:Uncharacterized protein n=1 Tax=Armatimonas rosea TaxID=685828 RepID=A0A7W9W5R5_ARMRO|nr:hypothetical protein [Armatimonas rosea]MBB6050719.1 hypothetical protein [Armatimonas rosea]